MHMQRKAMHMLPILGTHTYAAFINATVAVTSTVKEHTGNVQM